MTEPDYLVDAPTAAAYVAHLRQRPCAPGTIWSWATRGHIHRLARGRYDIREIDAHTRKVLMTELIEWLHAQLDADEQEINRHPIDGGSYHAENEPDGYLATGERNYPCDTMLTVGKPFALAELDAKRRILRLYENALSAQRAGSVSVRNRAQDEAACDVLGEAVRALALPYANRPGYLDTWRPE